MVYGKPRSSPAARAAKKRGAAITAPKQVHHTWITVVIRRTHYFMLRELAEKTGKTLGATTMELIADAFNAELQKIDPTAEWRPFIELPSVDMRLKKNRSQRPLNSRFVHKKTGREIKLITPLDPLEGIEELTDET
jgi:hypothetical protein